MRREALPSFFVQFECDVDASITPIRRVIAFLENYGFDQTECGVWGVAIHEWLLPTHRIQSDRSHNFPRMQSLALSV